MYQIGWYFTTARYLCFFGYQGTGGTPFVIGSSIALDFGSVSQTNYQFDFTLDFISSPPLPIEFPVDLYYGNGGGIVHSEGTMSLAIIPELATIAFLGLGSSFLTIGSRR